MIDVIPVDIDDLQDTWAIRGHPTLIRRRWSALGVDLDSDDSVTDFCATADGDQLITLLVDMASMSAEPELNQRAYIVGGRIAEIDDSAWAL